MSFDVVLRASCKDFNVLVIFFGVLYHGTSVTAIPWKLLMY